jgi:hypothetical protein
MCASRQGKTLRHPVGALAVYTEEIADTTRSGVPVHICFGRPPLPGGETIRMAAPSRGPALRVTGVCSSTAAGRAPLREH